MIKGRLAIAALLAAAAAGAGFHSAAERATATQVLAGQGPTGQAGQTRSVGPSAMAQNAAFNRMLNGGGSGGTGGVGGVRKRPPWTNARFRRAAEKRRNRARNRRAQR